MSESRKDVLLAALEAEVGGDSVDPGTLFTDDVVGWSPIVTVSGLTDMADLVAGHDVAFSNVVIMFRGLDEVGNKAFAEWVIEADHTGPLDLGEEPCWKHRDDISSWPASPWPTSAAGRSGRSGPTSTTSR